MDRHTKLLKEFSRNKTQAELLNKLRKSRKAVKIYDNGTSGLKLRSGRVIGHLKKTSSNI